MKKAQEEIRRNVEKKDEAFDHQDCNAQDSLISLCDCIAVWNTINLPDSPFASPTKRGIDTSSPLSPSRPPPPLRALHLHWCPLQLKHQHPFLLVKTTWLHLHYCRDVHIGNGFLQFMYVSNAQVLLWLGSITNVAVSSSSFVLW
ncbi:hypothetical protein Sjap_008635 [Stephania japonica]|uniref:Uncharacterized protein n=1 Tax=Stephania japonica TaxID=461633 RepID=A0AAP0PEN1_9MAGN